MGPFLVGLGIVAAALMLLGAQRSFALRGYAGLFDPDGPAEMAPGLVGGRFAGRRAQIGLITTGYGKNQRTKVQISIETALPIRLEAHTESLGTALRKAVRLVSDRPLGDEELDRRFALEFDDRGRTRKILDHYDARQNLLALADRGVDHILLTEGILTVERTAWFLVVPGPDRIREILGAMTSFLVSGESALSVGPPPATSAERPADLDPWPAARPHGGAITRFAAQAAVIVAMILAIWTIGPFWDFNGTVPWRLRLDRVRDLLPGVALLSGAFALAATYIARGRPLLWALALSWPLLAHAALILAVYVAIRVSGGPEVEKALVGELEMIPAGFRTAFLLAGAGFGGGLAGAMIGKRISPTEP